MENGMSIGSLSVFAISLLVVGIIVVVAFLIMASFSTTITTTQSVNVSSVNSLSNSQGTLNSTGLNVYINKYVNTNVSGYKNETTANFTGTAPSTIFIKLYVNGVATTTAYQKASIINATYPVNASKTTIYKVTVASNDTAYKNVTYYLLLNTNYYSYSSQLTAGGLAANNSIGYITSAFGTIASYLPLIALVVVAGIIITVVVLSFAFGGSRRSED